MSGTVRIGGQALADGVLMRTSRAWAVARDDGSVQVGALALRRTANIPVLRFLVGLAGGMRLAVGRGMLGRGAGAAVATRAKRRNGPFLWVLLAVEIVGLSFSFMVDGRTLPLWAGIATTAGPWVMAFAVLRLLTPGSLWRYHGAEHKAVAAHEAGIAMDDVQTVLAAPRVHDRCGTNLVFLAMIGGLTLGGLPAAFQVPAFVLLLATTAEAVTQAAGRPRSPLSRLVLAGGRALQRYVTTAEPTTAEQAIGCRALAACLALHEQLVASPGTGPAEVLVAA